MNKQNKWLKAFECNHFYLIAPPRKKKKGSDCSWLFTEEATFFTKMWKQTLNYTHDKFKKNNKILPLHDCKTLHDKTKVFNKCLKIGLIIHFGNNNNNDKKNDWSGLQNFDTQIFWGKYILSAKGVVFLKQTINFTVNL